MSSRRMWVALAALTLPLTVLPAAIAGASEGADLTAIGQIIPGQYIVTTASNPGERSDVDAVGTLSAKVRGMGIKVNREFSNIGSFSATMSDAQAETLRSEPGVLAVEPNRVVMIAADQSGPAWGLDRIDQRDLPLNQRYTSSNDGEGVNAYIIDTGINSSHREFAGRIDQGYDAYSDDNNPEDCAGHGTHVAGTVVGSTYGVAKKARVTAVRVLGCDGRGSTEDVIAGMDWVTKNARKPAVANMSLGGGASAAEDRAVTRMTQAGVTLVVAAGNSSANACNYSPARAPEAITVGSTTSSDTRSSFSNYGRCVDIFAPGSNVLSSWIGGSSATSNISGTSMASPHVAGVAALYLSANPNSTVAQTTAALVDGATPNKVSNAGSNSPNKLLFAGIAGATTPPSDTPTTPPTDTPTTPPTTPPATPTPTPIPNNGCGALTHTGSVGHGRWVSAATFTVSAATPVVGCLTGTAYDIDLYLQKQVNNGWTTVEKSLGDYSTEKITTTVAPGTYRWVVESYDGGGKYSLIHTN